MTQKQKERRQGGEMKMVTYEDVARKVGMNSCMTEAYVSYMRKRWGDEEHIQCQVGYAQEWAHRFLSGNAYAASDIWGQSLLERMGYKEIEMNDTTKTEFVNIYGKPPLLPEEATPAMRYAAGLRELADWIEAHPDIERPSTDFTVYALDTREEAAKVMQALKPCKKEFVNELFYLTRSFGALTLKYMFYRDKVCTPKVVGTRYVEARMKPARFIPEEFIPEHEEEIIEWDCEEPLLNQT